MNSKTSAGFFSSSTADTKDRFSSPGPSSTTPKQVQEDDSATESESEVEEPPVSDLKRKSSASDGEESGRHKRPKTDVPISDSATEPDSEYEEIPPSLPDTSRSKGLANTDLRPVDSDSATEPDSDSEGLLDPRLKPRPGFPLAPKQNILGPLILDREESVKVPAAINTYLREYQRDGVKFFWRQYKEGRGGLLGDDMGLTIQVISFLSAIMRKEGVRTDKHRRRKFVSKLQDGEAWKKRRQLPPANAKWPTCLIIAPSTVVHNWEREFETWGYFEVGMYNGNTKEREPVLHDFKLGRLDVVLTTFDLARRDIALLEDLPFSCVIVDEVHRVKNEAAKITVAFHQFNCPRRFGLTGTTIQNSYKEMWTILDWTNPGRLGTSRQWQGFVVKPLTAGQSAGAAEEERAKALVVALVLRDKLLPRFFLRRYLRARDECLRRANVFKGRKTSSSTKFVLRRIPLITLLFKLFYQLPEKTDQVVFCPLTSRQVAAYKHILNMAPVRNLTHKDEPCTCGSRKARKACCHPFVAGDVFKFMSILIKLSNHLGLILPGPKDTPEQTARNRALAEIAFPEGDIPKYGTAMMQTQYCGKWAVLEILLKEWRKETNKVLIFTKSVKLLEMLEFHLNNKGYGFLKLDGSTKQSDRMPMIDRFHNDPEVFIFLISTLAGGTGLNLTGANKVVIFDPNWNPAHDLQAMDRAFRFGQTRDVSVYRLLGAGSVEELIYARQIYKQQQMAIGYEASVQTRYFEGIQGDTAKRGELFGIENIFKLHEDKLATKMAIEKANLAELDWALANMGGSKRGKAKAASDIIEADAKVGKEDVYICSHPTRTLLINFEQQGNLRGLGALLFDDGRNGPYIVVVHHLLCITAPPPAEPREQDVIQKTLNAIGVTYSHLNDEILVPSRIEEERTKQTLKRRKKKSKPEESASKPQWPPRRKHHKPPPTPEEQLASRQQALIQLGMISKPSDIATFARDFARQSDEAQRNILADLDKWAKAQAEGDSD
ncbi:RAD26-like SNF2 family DNA-dependent ATPase [Laccaria bicolor S238N-H82]|uniref:RAD26-like SNF2 family DNA-dependent ATPase n=1 Tax=Laccaria bicolor (strain S238N-H82 / ATCC MYA-4686) TaxID=486041 RepID=B0D7Q2_LACBS|nr:RAD26-like SNF2 family DNA-dependent ATPase [Laccaria bicolor S238N-H82]EDR09438.1 RAD26-like SNF2 family DNA-dependent ATPase [Laccaria bicolor S238N-H82]|eukprot:XP_001879787.1 RAD26-like SNF2 family DNA-dependent ATPase [Laccaria bicolor S238N-H82]